MGDPRDHHHSDEIGSVRATYAAYDATRRERLWDRANRGFDRLKSDSERALVELLRSSLAARSGPSHVLDVGCGTGDLAVLAATAGLFISWTGLDLLPDRIEAARARVPEGVYVVGSADAMPFRDSSFDVATAITLFSSFQSARMEEDVAREIGRVLRPGGWLVWYDLRYGNPSNPAVHGVPASRLKELFPEWQMDVRSLTLAPPLARRLGPLTPIVYPLLHAIRPLRSHLIGRLRCPG